MSDVVLKFIAGSLQGHEFQLDSGQSIVIGRADDADLRIVEDTVSRKHARISCKNDEIVIEDLSKNGTYVNSRPVQTAVLTPGDLIYIGQSVLKVSVPRPARLPATKVAVAITSSRIEKPALVALGGDSLLSEQTLPAVNPGKPDSLRLAPAHSRAALGATGGEHFRGMIGDIALTDLLQLFSTARKNGVLVLRSADMLGRIFIERGQIIYATMDEIEPVNPQKVLYRLLRWTEGSFELDGLTRREFPIRINESTDHLLLEAMHELDEINNLGPDLPSLHAEVEVAPTLPAPLKELAPGDLDFIQLAMRHKLVRDILDHYTGNDFEGYTYLKSLIGRGFLVVTL
jgi:hypothetical protein